MLFKQLLYEIVAGPAISKHVPDLLFLLAHSSKKVYGLLFRQKMKLLRKSTSANPTRSPTPTATAHVNNCEDQSASPARDTNLGLFHQFNSIRSRRKSRADLLASIDSTASPSYRYQEEQVRKQHSLLDLRRRIVRKASTFNLHTRHRSTLQSNTDDLRSEHLFLDSDQDPAQPARASSLLAHDERPSTASTNYSEAVETIQQRESTDDSSSVYSQITTVPARRHTLAFTSPSDEKPLSIPKRASVDYLVAQRNQKVLEAQSEIVRQHSNYREKHIDGSGVWVKMATPSAAPPLAFEKLKQITVEVSFIRNSLFFFRLTDILRPANPHWAQPNRTSIPRHKNGIPPSLILSYPSWLARRKTQTISRSQSGSLSSIPRSYSIEAARASMRTANSP